jgi:hypothetical protein
MQLGKRDVKSLFQPAKGPLVPGIGKEKFDLTPRASDRGKLAAFFKTCG